MTTNTENTIPANTVAIVNTIPFLDALLKFKKIVPVNSARKILRGIRMEAQGNFLVLYGTNLDVDLRYNLDAETFLAPSWKEGFPAVVADYTALCGAFKMIRDKQARIEFHENHLLISDNAGNNQTQIPYADAVGNFPEPSPRQDADAEWEKAFASLEKNIKEKPEQVENHRANHFSNYQEFFIASEDMTAAMRYVLPGIAKGDTRYALGGVFMTGSARGVDFVSSNTHVLYRHQARIRGTLPDTVGFILHPALADWLAKNPCDDVFSVKTDKDRVFVSGVGFEITGRRIDGTFPRYNDVIPAYEQLPGRLTVDRKPS